MSRASFLRRPALRPPDGMFASWLACLLLATFAAGEARAVSLRPLGLDAHFTAAAAVCRGTVLGSTAFETADGHAYTRTVVRVDEAFKGTLPPNVAVVHRGGLLGNRGESHSTSPEFTVGEERLLFLARREDGTLSALQGPHSARKLTRATATTPGAARTTGPAPFLPPDEALLVALRLRASEGGHAGADVTDQAAVAPSRTAARLAASHGTLSGHSLFGGRPARFTQPDRGEPVPYLIDMAALPSGISSNQAFQAVSQGLAAWSAVSSVKFKFEGVQSFGMAAPDVPLDDGRLRIQLHDLHGFINDSSTLGQGGANVTVANLSTGWGTGGNVAGHEFLRITRGFAVVEHTDPDFNSNPTLLAEIVCHEVGHALGLAHSSESDPENNATLSEALMYFQAHNGGRGATLGAYDPPIIQQAYPQVNTPPYSFDRVMDVTTHFAAAPNVSGINEIELRGYDLQNTALTIATTDPTVASVTVGSDEIAIGSFALQGSQLKFTPISDPFLSNPRLDPTGSLSYARIYYRHSDGVNASPFGEVRVLSLNPDQNPNPSDGIPDDWQELHFGNADPNIGANAKPGDDFDGDGLTNLQEYRLRTDPKSSSSRLRITGLAPSNLQWLATPYELYEVQASTDLVTWQIQHPAILPTASTGAFTAFTNNAPHLFFRVRHVP
jgi:hypothetical protein